MPPDDIHTIARHRRTVQLSIISKKMADIFSRPLSFEVTHVANKLKQKNWSIKKWTVVILSNIMNFKTQL